MSSIKEVANRIEYFVDLKQSFIRLEFREEGVTYSEDNSVCLHVTDNVQFHNLITLRFDS